VGTRLRVEGSRIVRHEPFGHPQGTTISMENLFYNVPARLKFLRQASTERRHIDRLVTRYAMAYAHLSFSLEHDGRLTFRSPGSGALLDVLIEVYGLETSQSMIEIGDPERQGVKSVRVRGYASQPSVHRATRDHVTLFVNGRWIRDRGLTFAVEQAYHTLLPVSRHPVAVLQVSLPPEEVDVNVHPTKSEVKFQRRDAVFRVVQRGVREALIAHSPIPHAAGLEPSAAAGRWGSEGWQRRREVLVGAGKAQAAMDLLPPLPGSPTQPGAFSVVVPPVRPSTEGEPGQKLPPLRVLGQLAQSYIIAEGPEGMYLLDQHASHERIMYEKLLARQAGADLPVQTLLEPLAVELTPALAGELETWLEPLHALGFEIEPFGGDTILVRSVPAVLARTDVRQTLTGMLDELAIGEEPLAAEMDARVAAAACKRGAVKAGQTLTMEEMRAIVDQLEQTTAPRTCPHGRPTMILLSQAWMAREFGRR
jgi:DNA mismatch repair protein MutL